MHVKDFFTAQDLEKIKTAVGQAEGGTGGEIVPAVVAASDHYDEAAWTGATIGAITLPLTAALVHHGVELWGIPSPAWIALPAALGAVLGFLAARIPLIKRGLIPRHERARQVEQRAAAAFLEHEVFATRDRSGVLIFLSLFERRVVVLGDSGINAKVAQSDWDAVSATIVAGIKDGHPADALVAAVGQVGELLARCGVTRRDDDTDELADGLRIETE